jgi:hypothetical protein
MILLTNHDACPFGLALAKNYLKRNDTKVLLFTQNKSNDKTTLDTPVFQGNVHEPQDCNRLIAFLKQENMKITRLIHN